MPARRVASYNKEGGQALLGLCRITATIWRNYRLFGAWQQG